MSKINENIISEINCSKIDESSKNFLKWLVDFEREHSDKELFSYKQEIINKITELDNTDK